jgi:hypothetical protein
MKRISLLVTTLVLSAFATSAALSSAYCPLKGPTAPAYCKNIPTKAKAKAKIAPRAKPQRFVADLAPVAAVR